PLEGALTRSLEAFYDFVSVRGTLFRALVRSGVGSDNEVDHHVERVRSSIISQVVLRTGLDAQKPAIRWRLRAWIGAVESLALEISGDEQLTSEHFVAALTDAFLGIFSGPSMESKSGPE
ncbi:MAG: hypothetical protein CMH53_08790, partial [Myxococcales bacterium]|nr:hypothetical protein [Myxococcales bacterium]